MSEDKTQKVTPQTSLPVPRVPSFAASLFVHRWPVVLAITLAGAVIGGVIGGGWLEWRTLDFYGSDFVPKTDIDVHRHVSGNLSLPRKRPLDNSPCSQCDREGAHGHYELLPPKWTCIGRGEKRRCMASLIVEHALYNPTDKIVAFDKVACWLERRIGEHLSQTESMSMRHWKHRWGRTIHNKSITVLVAPGIRMIQVFRAKTEYMDAGTKLHFDELFCYARVRDGKKFLSFEVP